MGWGMAYGGLPFRDTGGPVPDVIFILCLILLMSGYCFYIYLPPLDFSIHAHSFLNNGLDNTEWASFISDLPAK